MDYKFLPAAESDDVFAVLVGELATGWVPMSIMGLTFFGVGGFLTVSIDSTLLLGATLAGSSIAVLKVVLMLSQRRGLRHGPWDRARATRWQRAHAVLTIGFAGLVGMVAAYTFLGRDPSLQMVATGMLFGYCSGTVTRVSFRPLIAAAAISVATIPASLAAASHRDAAGAILAIVFAVFLLGAFETIRYLYEASLRQIVLRLDMATLARNDPLTGLLNRLGLRESFRTRVGTRKPAQVALHYCDLDGFKPVNDRYGHAVGDMLLVALAERLRALAPASAIAARVGGDEFVILQGEVERAGDAEAFARRIHDAITAPFDLAGRTVAVGVSVGYVTSTAEMRDLDALAAAADAALYRVKAGGGGIAPA